MPLLNDFLWNICKSCCVEAIALWAGSFNKLVQECNCFLAWIFTLIFNHACLGRASHKSEFAILTCSLRNAWDMMQKHPFLRAEEHRKAEIPSSRTYHVAQAHSPTVGIVLHQGVVVSGEQRPAADPLCQLLHHCAGNGCSVKRGRASAWGHKRPQSRQSTVHMLLEADTQKIKAAMQL